MWSKTDHQFPNHIFGTMTVHANQNKQSKSNHFSVQSLRRTVQGVPRVLGGYMIESKSKRNQIFCFRLTPYFSIYKYSYSIAIAASIIWNCNQRVHFCSMDSIICRLRLSIYRIDIKNTFWTVFEKSATKRTIISLSSKVKLSTVYKMDDFRPPKENCPM